MRLVFAGTPQVAAETLTHLLAAGTHEVAAVLTRPDAPQGRSSRLVPSPVAQLAAEHGIEVLRPTRAGDPELASRLAELAPDCCPVVAYGGLIPKSLLDLPRYGWVNVHFSLLPRWRGAAPIQRAIMSGDKESGVTIMGMEEGLDTGPMCKVGRLAIGPTATAQSLHDELAALGARLMVEVLAQDDIISTPQPVEGVTYAKKIDKAEARIDFTRAAEEVRNHIHGLSPFPGAWFPVKGTRIKALLCEVVSGQGTPGTFIDDALTIACGSDAIRLLKLQREGKGAMESTDFLRGFIIAAGTEAA